MKIFQNNKNYLNFLNTFQKKAVISTDGAYLILAGAGSGKTRVLTYRLLYTLKEKKALPHQVLAVTFTNKAALEMKNRVSQMFYQSVESLWLGTFHSMSARILRKHAGLLNLKPNYIIIDEDDQLRIIKQICEREKIDTKEKSPKYFLNIIGNYKNKAITLEILKKNKKNKKASEIEIIYENYEKELIKLNCVDFGNLLIHCLTIFKKYPDVLNKYQSQFKYILVDEYQDINLAQQFWLQYLYNKNKNICCVGDDDQSIYSWRGADVSNILKFEKVFKKPTILKLEQNYRSTQNILKCASLLIANNKGRYGKELWSNNNKGDKIDVRGFWETKEEAIFISDKIEKLISKKIPLSQIAILLRIAAHTRSLEERFLNIGIPYKIVGGLRFYERKEIKDVIAYLRLVNNLGDDLAFQRIINVPKRGIGQITLRKISSIARTNNLTFFDAAQKFVSQESSKVKIEISNFLIKINKWHKLKKEINHEELTQAILEDLHYIEYLEQQTRLSQNPENFNKIDNIKEFIDSLKDFENLTGFLEHVGLVMENMSNTNIETINIMTMHSAKGLEFDYVFLTGWEEEVFPSKRSIDELGKAGLEEERRLAYVALTRSRKKLYITYVNQNRYSYASRDYNIPSRFIDELPSDLIDFKDSQYLENKDFVNEFINEPETFEEVLTPGRKRLLSKSKKNLLEWDFNQDIYEESQITSGVRVFHQKYGYGKVIFADDDVAEVKFEKSSNKQVLKKYLRVTN